jgi:hypothetical protein
MHDPILVTRGMTQSLLVDAATSVHTLRPVPPTYRKRLQIEGLALALCGALGTIVLLTVSAQARRDPLNTAGQLAAVAVLLAWLGPRSVRHAIAASEPRSARDLGSGDPTPVWHLPLIVVTLAAAAGLLAGWDAGVRVTGGCVLVGLTQALVLERIVAADEHETGRRYFRIAGSRILRGTRLGHIGGLTGPHAAARVAASSSSSRQRRERDAAG